MPCADRPAIGPQQEVAEFARIQTPHKWSVDCLNSGEFSYEEEAGLSAYSRSRSSNFPFRSGPQR